MSDLRLAFDRLDRRITTWMARYGLLLLRLGWYTRQEQPLALTRGFFFGGTVEAGNIWTQRAAMRLSDLRTGFSVYLGADTGIGPLYPGLTSAPRGSTGLALFIGRP